jgi:hypothetical protein
MIGVVSNNIDHFSALLATKLKNSTFVQSWAIEAMKR